MSRIEQLIGEIEEYIDSCKFQPLSTTKIIVNKEELDELLVELRLRIPDEIKQYQKIISNQEAILSDAHTRADALLAEATAQTNELVNEHEIMQKAYAHANEVIEQAQAQAQAIMKVQQATADAIKLINEANPGDGVLKIKALEAFTAAANGKATKIIVPSEIQGLAGLAAAAKTVFDTEDPKPAAPKTTLPKQ